MQGATRMRDSRTAQYSTAHTTYQRCQFQSEGLVSTFELSNALCTFNCSGILKSRRASFVCGSKALLQKIKHSFAQNAYAEISICECFHALCIFYYSQIIESKYPVEFHRDVSKKIKKLRFQNVVECTLTDQPALQFEGVKVFLCRILGFFCRNVCRNVDLFCLRKYRALA